MIKFADHRWSRLAAVGALVVALGLSACGRKGPLDPPPYASAPDNLQAAPAGSAQLAPADTQVGVGPDGKAVAPPPGQRQPFILDWLVD